MGLGLIGVLMIMYACIVHTGTAIEGDENGRRRRTRTGTVLVMIMCVFWSMLRFNVNYFTLNPKVCRQARGIIAENPTQP